MSLPETTDNNSHAVFQNDPLKLQELVNKYVEVTKTNGKTSSGTVFTIDPVSESVLLLSRTDGKVSAEIVAGHAVSKINLISKPSSFEQPDESIFFPKNNVISSQDTEKKKLGLKAWLQDNRIPIEESGELLRLDDVLTIYPPYEADNVVSQNEVVLERVQNLIRNSSLNE